MKHHALINVILLLRPHQWIKNLFVFLPLFFDGKLLVGGGSILPPARWHSWLSALQTVQSIALMTSETGNMTGYIGRNPNVQSLPVHCPFGMHIPLWHSA